MLIYFALIQGVGEKGYSFVPHLSQIFTRQLSAHIVINTNMRIVANITDANKEHFMYNVNAATDYHYRRYINALDNAAGDKAFTCNINKNVFESCKDASGVYFSEDAKTDGLSFSKNYYKDSDNLQVPYSPTMTAFDPSPSTFTGKSAFKDPEAGDFTITNNTVKNAGVGNTDFVKK